MDELESLDDKSDASCFLCLRRFFFLLIIFLIDLLEFLFFDELDLFNDESDDNGSGSRYPIMCAFTFCSGNYIGCVSGVGSGIFVLTGIDPIGEVVLLVAFVPRGAESKGG